MRKLLCLFLLLPILLTLGCSNGSSETNLKIEGIDKLSQALLNRAVIGMRPDSLQVGDKNILFVGEGKTRDGNFTVQFKFYELVDGKLKQIEFIKRRKARPETD